MRRIGGILIAAVLLASGTCAWPAAGAEAQIAWKPCGQSNEYACGHLSVPLDPGGTAPGTITLAMRRHRAPLGEAREAVIALAGGPGQAAIPFTEQFTQMLGPILATRDLIVLDQRGIGLSGALSCHRFELGAGGPGGRAITECANELGASRGYYTTAQTVADIEAIRQAGGYEKLVLYGTSYGTKVAERYAQAYPSHVSALVLDSVVPPNGPEPLERTTFAAVPRVLRQLCAARACAHITPEPVGDLARVVKRIGAGALRGRWIDEHGHGHTTRITADELLQILVAGDLEPALRAGFPAAVRSAAEGDVAPLARLVHQAEEAGGEEEESPGESFDTPLFLATTCEEELFPWDRASNPAQRLREAGVRIHGLPALDWAPFGPGNVLGISDMQACAYWPYTTPAPAPVQTPFPNVPTLILSGADDLRTPTANAREVAAQIPDSHLLVVPDVGHSVLGTDLSGCSSKALQALFRPAPIEPCRGGRQLLSLLGLTPLAPARLSDVSPARGFRGKTGRTLRALSLTLADFERQAEMRGLGALVSGTIGQLENVRIGGLRTGWAYANGETSTFHGYSYVPGVTVTGTIDEHETTLALGGRAGAHGLLRLAGHGRLVGALGGQRVNVPARSTVADGMVGLDAQAALKLAPRGSAARADAGRPVRLRERVP